MEGPKDLLMKIEAAVLHRLLYNAKLYQVGKDSPGMKLVFDEDGAVLMSVFDRYTYVEDYGMYTPGSYTYLMELDSDAVKAAELALRELKDVEELTLEVSTSNKTLSVYWGEDLLVTVEYVYPRKDEDDIASLVSPAEHSNLTDPIALLGDRFRKLALIQPQEYPVDMRFVEHTKFGPMVAFKKGPTVVGALAALDRDVLHKTLSKGNELW